MGDRAYNAVSLMFGMAFALGVNGFVVFPNGLNMPLWLAVALTMCGLAGCIALPYFLRRAND